METNIDEFFEIKEACQVSNPPYWTAEVYGFGKEIREYGYYSLSRPLLINTDHGVSSTGIIYESEIKCDAPVQFYHLPLTVQSWRNRYAKPCYVLYSPFVFYRKRNNITKNINAVGTLVFPAHTTPEIDDKSSIEKYISDLEKLPEIYKPISICLHYHDVIKGMHKTYLNKGYKVYSAGHPNDYQFIPNFYKILRNFRFSTSNMFMSCLFYSVELGIPHFIYGNEPILVNNADSNLNQGTYDVLQIPRVAYISNMFKGPLTTISPEQEELVISDLGLTEGLSRAKMCFLLHKIYITQQLKLKYSLISGKLNALKQKALKSFN